MELDKYLQENRSWILDTFRRLISIKSVQEDPVAAADGGVYPFGQGVQDAFAFLLETAEKDGFLTRDADHYGGHIDFPAAGAAAEAGKPEVVGILGHLDVVPEGNDWSFDPYSGECVDGQILGRGTTDDKGPMFASYVAMKALKESGFVPARTIRLILGLDEETNWQGMDYYLAHEGAPDFGFTPDANFPVIMGEKGLLQFDLVRKLTGRGQGGFSLRRLEGGNARNAVPDKCRAVLLHHDPKAYEKVREAADAEESLHGMKIRTKRIGKSLEIVTEGQGAHAATPYKGVNAVSIMMALLGRLELADDGLADFVSFYNQDIGFRTDGADLGAGLSDEASGSLTLCVGMARLEGHTITVSVDTRYPVTCTDEQVFAGIRPELDRHGIGTVLVKHEAPIYQSADSPLVRTLLDVYQEETGDRSSEPIVIGGGTFARACPNIVAFGGLFPEDPDLMHQRNEKISEERFFSLIRIYAEAIRRLASADFTLEER